MKKILNYVKYVKGYSEKKTVFVKKRNNFNKEIKIRERNQMERGTRKLSGVTEITYRTGWWLHGCSQLSNLIKSNIYQLIKKKAEYLFIWF